MLTPNGQVKVMDFGIARDLASGATTMTQTSAVIGTAQYLSPEQARGEAVDARSDVYAAGCVLFELLCGHPPFVGDSPVSVAYQHVREDPRSPSELNPEVTPDVDAVVLKALAKNPANRYQSAAEMRADLLRAAGGRPVLATPVMSNAETALLGQQGEPARVGDPERRRASTWVLVALGVLGVLAVVALVVGLILTNQSPRQVDVPAVLGMTPTEAEETLAAVGLRGEAGEPFVGECQQEEGRVESQEPAAATTVDEDSTVTYHLCGGPELVLVPDVVGLQEDRARQELADAGLRARTELVEDDEDEGEVVRTDPPADQEVEVDTEVVIFVSSGTILEVPDVTGRPEAEARGALQQAGFQVVTEDSDQQPSSPDDVGRVESQSPGGGETAPRDSEVTLFVYPDGPALEVPAPTVDQAAQTVTVNWNNGIYGGVTIDWGDGNPPETFADAEGQETHQYAVNPGESQTFTIRVTATDHSDRTVTHEVEITAGP
jgi:serine/threonine-protein kinase